MKRHGMARGRLAAIAGTVCLFECPKGHTTRRDYSKGKVSQRVSERGLEILRRGWERDGVTFRCRHCADGTEPKRRGRRPALTPEQVEHARDLYRNTSCSLERIGRHFGVSQGTAERAVFGKPPYDDPGA